MGNVSNSGALEFDRSDTVVFGSAIRGTGSLDQLGNGTLVLTGSNSYSGGTTIDASTLRIGNGGSSGSITGKVSISNGGVLAFSRSGNVVFGGAITDDGTGTLIQLGPGNVTLTGDSTYGSANDIANGGTGNGTQVAGGTLQIGNGGTAGSIRSDVHLSGSGLLAFNRSNSVSYGGAITDDGLGGTGLVKLGPAMLTLTDCSTYSFFGTTTISGGTLRLNDSTYQTMWGNVSNMATLVFNEPPLSVSDGDLRQRLQREHQRQRQQ